MVSASGGGFVVLDEGGFEFFDFGFLLGGEFAAAQFVAGIFDFLEHVAQLAGGAASGGSGIVEFVREARGKFAQRSQAVALLLHASDFANSVRHQADQTLG